MIKLPLSSFRQRATLAFAVFAFAVLLVVVAIGQGFNERVEESIWNTMLEIELEQLETLRQLGPDATPGKRVRTYVAPAAGAPTIPVPTEILRLRPGFHDDVTLDNRLWAVLVQDDAQGRIYLAFDITQLEADEKAFQYWGMMGVATMLLLLTALAYWLASRLSTPILALATEVAARDPDETGPIIGHQRADLETAQIAAAIDGYVARINGLLHREKEFLAAVGHELRTPIAVISGANDVLNNREDMPDHLRRPLDRIVRAANDANATLTVLLFLAREDEKESAEYESCRVDKLIENLVSDHEHLLNEHQQIRIGRLDATQVHGPARLVSIALGNILRNAIQHGQSGPIDISLCRGIFSVTDVGPGMPAATLNQLSALPSHPWKATAGYGLYIIQRIAARLGWHLRVDSAVGKGTTVSLILRVDTP
ncbi:HAMP domain-containing histidine kinase [Permianibacter sp. IMCC34836]|uniref:sensor histidine kinase n=1 Tax=Permianibacter fluminis TaxID=2738515 RepID=UPI0015531574|nr:HAMP domain-containing sensor histidine kinase [Permianibacter fluminis]NQD37773.1 HAMP domain-containing histidine kinase [Permianibacter fluminis]